MSKSMEYTVTYPVHLGQEIWVDTKIFPSGEIDPSATIARYVKGEVRSLIVQMKGRTERKSIKFCIKAPWKNRTERTPYGEVVKYENSFKYFKLSVGCIGETVFLENPEKPAVGMGSV